MSKSHYIIEDVYNIYSSINEEADSETIEEIDNFAGDVYATIASSMLHEGYSASGILGFLSTAADEEILERFGDFNEDLITESTISEEYVNEQVEQLDEFVGAALRVLGAGVKAAKYAKPGVLSKLGQGLQGAGRAASRVAKQGPRASSVVRSGLSKLKGAATAGLSKLKSGAVKVGSTIGGAASKLPGAVGRVAKTLIPGAVGFALGKATSGGDKKDPGRPQTPPGGATPGRPPSAPPSAGASPTQPRGNAVASRPAAPKRAAQTGDKKTDMASWAKANPKLAARQAERDRTRGTNQTTNPLMKDMKAGLPDPKPKASAASNAVKSSEKKQSRLDKALSGVTAVKKSEGTKKESYDIVLDYLISEGHAESVEEAHYIMLRLEADHVQEIVESAS